METDAQKTSLVDVGESKSRLISQLEEFVTFSCQSYSKVDQAKRISSSLQFECGREIGRSTFEKGNAIFSRVPLQITNRTSSKKKLRETINNLITHLGEEEASPKAEHMVWCDTELTTKTQPKKEKNATVEKLHATVECFERQHGNGSGGTPRPVVPTRRDSDKRRGQTFNRA